MSGWQIAIGLLAAVGSGALGSVIAPWAQHAVGVRKARQDHRANLIAGWRAMLARHSGPEAVRKTAYMASPIVNEPEYTSLRGHLTATELRSIEGDPKGAVTVVVGSASLLPPLKAAMGAVDRLEREWKLI